MYLYEIHEMLSSISESLRITTDCASMYCSENCVVLMTTDLKSRAKNESSVIKTRIDSYSTILGSI